MNSLCYQQNAPYFTCSVFYPLTQKKEKQIDVWPAFRFQLLNIVARKSGRVEKPGGNFHF